MKGNLFIISSPSGGGKGTLIREVLKTVPDVGYSVSFTTRQPRRGEEHGREYFFVSLAEFERMRANEAFLEWAEVHNNFYGTSLAQVENELGVGRDVILEIDVQGAESVKSLVPESVGIFIMPPSYKALFDRLERRGSENPANLNLRLQNARGEVAHYREFDYVVVNDQVARAATQMAAIFLAERARTNRMQEPIENILKTFE